METEKRDEQDKEKRVLIKKLTMTCRSYVSEVLINNTSWPLCCLQLDDEEAKKQELNEEEFLDPDDEFFKEYRARLMRQMQERLFNAYVICLHS